MEEEYQACKHLRNCSGTFDISKPLCHGEFGEIRMFTCPYFAQNETDRRLIKEFREKLANSRLSHFSQDYVNYKVGELPCKENIPEKSENRRAHIGMLTSLN